METTNLDKETSKGLDRYFNSKKFYLQIGLTVAGVIVVLIVYHKIKRQYTS